MQKDKSPKRIQSEDSQDSQSLVKTVKVPLAGKNVKSTDVVNQSISPLNKLAEKQQQLQNKRKNMEMKRDRSHSVAEFGELGGLKNLSRREH